MSHTVGATDWPIGSSSGLGGSALTSEKNARSSISPKPTFTPTPAPKLRSCAVCRSRKVRCDKLSPCSNCRRANIACVFPSKDRPPRWASRITKNAASTVKAPQGVDPELGDAKVDQVVKRLQNLESLVKELSGQLEHANAAASSTAGSSSSVNSPGSSTHERDADHQIDTLSTTGTNVQKQFGRLVLQDAKQSRYVSSGFWSRVNDEVCVLVLLSSCLGT